MTGRLLYATVWVDVETTSLDPPWLPDGRRPWEIAMVRVPWHRQGDVVDLDACNDVTLTVTNVDLTYADQKSLAMNGWRERGAPWQGSPAESAWNCRRPWMRDVEGTVASAVQSFTAGTVLAGANPGFDVETLASMLHRHRLTPGWHYTPFDVKSAAIATYGLPDDASTRECAEAAGLDVDAFARHSARGDVDMAIALDEAITTRRRLFASLAGDAQTWTADGGSWPQQRPSGQVQS